MLGFFWWLEPWISWNVHEPLVTFTRISSANHDHRYSRYSVSSTQTNVTMKYFWRINVKQSNVNLNEVKTVKSQRNANLTFSTYGKLYKAANNMLTQTDPLYSIHTKGHIYKTACTVSLNTVISNVFSWKKVYACCLLLNWHISTI